MRIAICDDDPKAPKALEDLERYLRGCAGERGMEFAVDAFSRAEDFLASDRDYTVVFMDVYLPGESGIGAVKELPASSARQVVFTTTSREHAVEAFGLNAAHYLIKPLSPEAVSEALDRCFDRLGLAQTPGRTLSVKTGSGSVSIPIDQIVYVEVFDKRCVVHTRKSEFQTYTSLDALFERLDAGQFLRVQRSYVINMDFVDAFLADRVVLRDGAEITISRGRRNELKEQYQAYLFRLARGDGK